MLKALDSKSRIPSNVLGRGIILILLLAMGLRLGWGLSRPSDDASLVGLPDQLEYLQLGRNLLAHHELRMFDSQLNDTLYAYRMPGYPILIALSGGNVVVVRVVQSILDTSTVLAGYLLAIRWFGVRYKSRALFAAAIVALNPFLIFFSSLVLSETLFTCLLAWGMVGLSGRLFRSRVIGALLLVVSIYVRPGAIGLPVILGLVGAVAMQDYILALRTRWKLPVGTSMLLLTLLVLLPWAYRNQMKLGTWIWTTTNAGFTEYDGFNPDADGSSNQSHFRSWPELKDLNEVQRSEYLHDLARQWAGQNPGKVVTLAGKKIARTWSVVPLSAEYGGNLKYVLVGLCYSLPLFILTIWGVLSGVHTTRISRGIQLFLLLPAIYFTVVHAITVGSLRYRIPSEVGMAVVAASGAGFIRAKKYAELSNEEVKQDA